MEGLFVSSSLLPITSVSQERMHQRKETSFSRASNRKDQDEEEARMFLNRDAGRQTAGRGQAPISPDAGGHVFVLIGRQTTGESGEPAAKDCPDWFHYA